MGAPCGHHGNYTFYKAFKYNLHGNQKILSLGEFFLVKIWEEEDIISIGEAQLLWEDRTSGQILVSLRIYFLPENTPEGRCEEHGEVSTNMSRCKGSGGQVESSLVRLPGRVSDGLKSRLGD